MYVSFSAIDLLLALGLDARQLSSSPRICGQLVERDLDLEHVLARAVAGLARARLPLALAERVADLALALADAALLLGAEAEVREVDLRQRDRDQVLALACRSSRPARCTCAGSA